MSTDQTPALARATEAIDTAYDVHTGLAHWERVRLLARSAVSAALHDPDDPDWLRNVQLAHQSAREDGDGAWECLCGYGLGDGYRTSVRHAAHQADAVRAAILGADQ